MKIYVASSWKNIHQPDVVNLLRREGHSVYDFRNPPNKSAFHWSSIDPNWKEWNTAEFEAALNHPLAEKGFSSDYQAMAHADACVLVLPCGRSAHAEAGWFAGKGKPVIVFIPESAQPIEPELMYKMFYMITGTQEELINFVDEAESELPRNFAFSTTLPGEF